MLASIVSPFSDVRAVHIFDIKIVFLKKKKSLLLKNKKKSQSGLELNCMLIGARLAPACAAVIAVGLRAVALRCAPTDRMRQGAGGG